MEWSEPVMKAATATAAAAAVSISLLKNRGRRGGRVAVHRDAFLWPGEGCCQ